MIVSILFIVLFTLCLFGVILFPKTDKKINAIKAAVMGTMAIFAYQALLAFVYDKIGIRVGIESTCVSMAIAAAVLWAIIIRTKKIQRVFVRWTDIISLVILAVFMIAISLHMFTPHLRLSYLNTDPANHFNMAMVIVNGGKIEETVYFSAFVDAMFIQLFAPLLTVAKYYKAFIAADIFMHILEIWMFYVLTITISGKKAVRFLAPVIAMGYFMGYPAYSYMTGGFVYWSTGGMVLLLIVYALILMERHKNLLKYTAVLLFLAAFANSCCNALFIPVNYFALFVALIALIMKERDKKSNIKLILGILVFLIMAGGAVAFLFFDKWGGSFERVIAQVSRPGGIYTSLYTDIIYFIPALLLVFYYTLVKREYSKTISLMTICMLLCAVAMYVFVYNNMMSLYYFYKIYYNIWMFGWLLVVLALDIMSDKKQLAGFFSYGGMIAVLAVLTFTNYDLNMWDKGMPFNANYTPTHMFALYWYNSESLRTDYEKYEIPLQIMDVCSYAVDEIQDEDIPALVTNDTYFYWFDGMRGQNTRKYKPYKKELPDILARMDKEGIKKILVDKKDEFYLQNQAYFSLCSVVYENERAAILTYPGESWSKILDSAKEYSEKKLELYSYVKNELKGQRVPLMASKTASLDFVIYKQKTKMKSTDCYTWNYDAKGNLDNLNTLGIQYILVLYDDSYYSENQYYYDSQETVFENEAGKIVRCRGEQWSTEYR